MTHESATGSEWRGRTAIAISIIGGIIAVSLGVTAVMATVTGNTPPSEAVAALSTLGGIVIGAVGTYLGMQAKMPTATKEIRNDSGPGPRSDSAGTGEHGVPPAARPEGLPPAVE